MALLDTFLALRNYAKGKINKYDLEDSDELITRVNENNSNKGLSEVYIEFDNEDQLLESLGLSEDDRWFYRVITSPYSDYEFIDWYSVKEDFENGYGLYYHLNDENKEKLAEISKFIVPMKVDWGNEKFTHSLSEKLLTNFKDDIEDILSDYQLERNREMLTVSETEVTKELNEYLEDFGFVMRGDAIVTTVGNLVGLYIKENAIHLSLKELFERIFEETSSNIGGWNDRQYDFEDDKVFDTESFNSYTSKKLDDILEKIGDGVEEGATMQDYTEMTDRVSKKFKQGEWYFLPKDKKKEVRFNVVGFEYPSMKVVVELSKGFKKRKIKLSEDNFYNLLYQPTLFNLEEI